MTATRPLADIRPSRRLRLSMLWTALMFLYVYGDYFNMYTPGKLDAMADGQIGVGAANPAVMIAISLMMAIPALMIVLCQYLPAVAVRWSCCALGLAYTLILGATLSGAPTFYIVYGIIEIALTLTIAIQALRWPKAEGVES